MWHTIFKVLTWSCF